jgi:hypothetical protein
MDTSTTALKAHLERLVRHGVLIKVTVHDDKRKARPGLATRPGWDGFEKEATEPEVVDTLVARATDVLRRGSTLAA